MRAAVTGSYEETPVFRYCKVCGLAYNCWAAQSDTCPKCLGLDNDKPLQVLITRIVRTIRQQLNSCSNKVIR